MYNPFQPSDGPKVVRERRRRIQERQEKKKKEAYADKKRPRSDEEDKQQAQQQLPPPAAAGGGGGGLGGGRHNKMMALLSRARTVAAATGAGASTAASDASTAATCAAPASSSLSSSGVVGGQSSSSSITSPTTAPAACLPQGHLEFRQAPSGANVIVQAGQQQPQPQMSMKPAVRGKPSACVLLRNMVGPSEVDGDLQGDVAQECQKFGRVRGVHVVVLPPGTGGVGVGGSGGDEELVRIFVRYDTVASSFQAAENLNGRLFGGRRVCASFFPVAAFDGGDFGVQPAEVSVVNSGIPTAGATAPS